MVRAWVLPVGNAEAHRYVIPFRSTDPFEDAPLFFRRTIRGGRCVARATGRPPRRSDAEKEPADRLDVYCELVLQVCASEQTRLGRMAMAGRKKLLKAISSKPSGRALPWVPWPVLPHHAFYRSIRHRHTDPIRCYCAPQTTYYGTTYSGTHGHMPPAKVEQ